MSSHKVSWLFFIYCFLNRGRTVHGSLIPVFFSPLTLPATDISWLACLVSAEFALWNMQVLDGEGLSFPYTQTNK